VGVALSDEGGRLATPLEVIEVSGAREALGPVVELIRKEGAVRVVIGLPLNMDDTIGPAARDAIAWGQELAESAGDSVAVVFVDERLSSFEAEQTLADRKRSGERMTRKRKKERLDALAAAGFLQAFLDGKLAPLNSPGGAK
jgi:putative pre-16S rRNA nuclease